MEGTAMYRHSAKLENVRRNVCPWQKIFFGDIFKTKVEVEEKLEDFQKAMVEGLASEDMI